MICENFGLIIGSKIEQFFQGMNMRFAYEAYVLFCLVVIIIGHDGHVRYKFTIFLRMHALHVIFYHDYRKSNNCMLHLILV